MADQHGNGEPELHETDAEYFSSVPRPTNKIAYASELAQAARDRGEDYNAARKAVQEESEREHPVYVGTLDSITYNDRSNRYVGKFGRPGSGKIDTLKITAAVAEFLLKHGRGYGTGGYPTINVHFTDGEVDAVYLLFLSR